MTTKLALVLLLAMGAGCSRDSNAPVPVFDNPSTGGPGIDTVPPSPPSPLTSEHPHAPPLGEAHPENLTGSDDAGVKGQVQKDAA